MSPWKPSVLRTPARTRKIHLRSPVKKGKSYRRRDSNPHLGNPKTDFKSAASTVPPRRLRISRTRGFSVAAISRSARINDADRREPAGRLVISRAHVGPSPHRPDPQRQTHRPSRLSERREGTEEGGAEENPFHDRKPGRASIVTLQLLQSGDFRAMRSPVNDGQFGKIRLNRPAVEGSSMAITTSRHPKCPTSESFHASNRTPQGRSSVSSRPRSPR